MYPNCNNLRRRNARYKKSDRQSANSIAIFPPLWYDSIKGRYLPQEVSRSRSCGIQIDRGNVVRFRLCGKKQAVEKQGSPKLPEGGASHKKMKIPWTEDSMFSFARVIGKG